MPTATHGTTTAGSFAAAANSAPSPGDGCGLLGTLINGETQLRREKGRVEERMKHIFIQVCVCVCVCVCVIQGVSEGIVNILGGGSIKYL